MLIKVSISFCVIVFVSLFGARLAQAQEWITYNTDNTELPSNNILSIAIDDNGIFWFGTDSGLAQFDGESWKTYTTTSNANLADNYINDISFVLNDTQSILWLATENGISMVDVSNTEDPIFNEPYRTENAGLIDNATKTLTVDPGSVKWFGTFKGLSSFTQDVWGNYSTGNYWIENDKVVSLDAGPDSMVYIGTEGGGVSRLKLEGVDGISSASPLDKTWTGADEPEKGKLTSNNIYSILIEDNGHQWFGTDLGVALHTSYNTKRDWVNYTVKEGLIDNFVQAICKENQDVFWFGTPEGVSRFDRNSWENFTIADGPANNNIRDIAVDKNGLLWFATEGGISVLNNPNTNAPTISNHKDQLLSVKNYPNPFSTQTLIEFDLKIKSDIAADIFNINGQHVIKLLNEKDAYGKKSMVWNRVNSYGNTVPNGIYFVQFKMGQNISIHKILVN